MARKLAVTASRPSKAHASAKNGTMGRRPDQATKARPFTGPWRESDRLTRLLTAQLAAAHRLSANAASGKDAPLAAPIQARPSAATTVPAIWARVGLSWSTIAAKASVKKAWDWW